MEKTVYRQIHILFDRSDFGGKTCTCFGVSQLRRSTVEKTVYIDRYMFCLVEVTLGKNMNMFWSK